ncbi:hypothetical protein HanRHA438_Chr12g0539921 [Helianthus annuus]|nr:hypothetical protein HanRHA438_Chr12g0539921 [Helianthus annuus]
MIQINPICSYGKNGNTLNLYEALELFIAREITYPNTTTLISNINLSLISL